MRLTVSQALVRFLEAQQVELDGRTVPYFAGVNAIFGHGNVLGLGEALYERRGRLPTFRAHNEQAMGHTAIAFAKAHRRRRAMICTTSIGPGATNLATAAATAHANRLPLLLLPGDTFANRRPDPVLQQIEDFENPFVTANDCLRPVSRFWHRITRPGSLPEVLSEGMRVLTDSAQCGPVTLALPQDIQAEAYDYNGSLFEPRLLDFARVPVDSEIVAKVSDWLRAAERPLIVCGGGVHYALASRTLEEFAQRHGVPVVTTQAGKGALSWEHACNLGGVGVTGTLAANRLARRADLVLAVGTRLTDFTTQSRTLFESVGQRKISMNSCVYDAQKHGCFDWVVDAKLGLEALSNALGGWSVSADWTAAMRDEKQAWQERRDALPNGVHSKPTDAQVVLAVNRLVHADTTVVAAAGGLPGELHKLWQVRSRGTYHVEYGYSCMGYEIAGGLGVKMAHSDREVVVMVGDGSYLMLNSEIATSVARELKLIVVLLDNRGFGCIHRLQTDAGCAPHNNRLDANASPIDFVSHAQAMGAGAERVTSVESLSAAWERAQAAANTYVLVIETDPEGLSVDNEAWWDVPPPEVSSRDEVVAARRRYEQRLASSSVE